MQKVKIAYIYDALCGWCYGMGPQLDKLSLEFEILVLSGGMVVEHRIGPATEMASYIRGAYKRVEEMTGVTFGKPYLDVMLSDEKAIFSSLRPGFALSAFKQTRPYEAYRFAKRIQKAIFQDGWYPNEWATYTKIGTEFGLDADAFLELMQSEALQKETMDEFKLVKRMGITGFPTVLAVVDGENYLVGKGFTTADLIVERIDSILNKRVKV
jgi:putative protein-disulfide isomerase